MSIIRIPSRSYMTSHLYRCFFFFFFNDTATTEIYTLSLHDALPISLTRARSRRAEAGVDAAPLTTTTRTMLFLSRKATDRKSTRLNSSHLVISYAVFCLKKKKNTHPTKPTTARTRTLHELSSASHIL